MMIRIVVENAQSRIEADKAIIDKVRPMIAYRAADLPPIPVQAVIKRFFKNHRSHGRENDCERLYRDRETAARLEELGCGEENPVTPRQLDSLLRVPGYWDGWKPLISPGGWFGSGLVEHVKRALSLHLGYSAEVIDTRVRPASGEPVRATIPLYPFQIDAVEAWLAAEGRGVVNLPPRAGKTRIAMEAVRRLGLPTLFVVPTKNLVAQTVEAFSEFFPPGTVEGVTGGRPDPKAQRRLNHTLVWVATPPTAAGPKPDTDNRRDRRGGMQGIESRLVLIVDEWHHAAADTWQDISLAARSAYYRMGLTGTHYRADGKDLAMHSVLSRCVYRRSVSEMVELGRLVPARVAMVRFESCNADKELSGFDVYPLGVVDHPFRNAMLVRAAVELVALGKRTMVLVKEIRHAEQLAARIPGAAQIDGRNTEEIIAQLDNLRTGRIKCLVGTSVIGEGVDVPAADALVYAVGGRSKVKVVQDYFRVLTATPGKGHGIVIDAADTHHPKLLENAANRLSLYRSQKAFTCEVISEGALSAWLRQAVR